MWEYKRIILQGKNGVFAANENNPDDV